MERAERKEFKEEQNREQEFTGVGTNFIAGENASRQLIKLLIRLGGRGTLGLPDQASKPTKRATGVSTLENTPPPPGEGKSECHLGLKI